jgi:serine/threonine protein kinase
MQRPSYGRSAFMPQSYLHGDNVDGIVVEPRGVIGVGGRGHVFRGTDASNTPVAIKYVRFSSADAGAAEQFMREALLLRYICAADEQLARRNLVCPNAVGFVENTSRQRRDDNESLIWASMVMRQGTPADQFLAHEYRANPHARAKYAARLLKHVTLNANALHKVFVSHLDLKLSNVLVIYDDSLPAGDYTRIRGTRLIDLDLACAWGLHTETLAQSWVGLRTELYNSLVAVVRSHVPSAPGGELARAEKRELEAAVGDALSLFKNTNETYPAALLSCALAEDELPDMRSVNYFVYPPGKIIESFMLAFEGEAPDVRRQAFSVFRDNYALAIMYMQATLPSTAGHDLVVQGNRSRRDIYNFVHRHFNEPIEPMVTQVYEEADVARDDMITESSSPVLRRSTLLGMLGLPAFQRNVAYVQTFYNELKTLIEANP